MLVRCPSTWLLLSRVPLVLVDMIVGLPCPTLPIHLFKAHATFGIMQLTTYTLARLNRYSLRQPYKEFSRWERIHSLLFSSRLPQAPARPCGSIHACMQTPTWLNRASGAISWHVTPIFLFSPFWPFPLLAVKLLLEHHIAKISNARHAFVVSSGMGALDVILRGLKKDDEIVAGEVTENQNFS